jgi:hypothetical protein
MKLSKSFSAMSQALCLLLISAFTMPAAVTVVESVRLHTGTQVALNGGTNGCVVSGASVTTGTTPSIITCVAAHNLVTGDQVQITGIVGTTTDNVTAWVTVLSPTTFAIYNNVNMQSTQGIIGTGTYSSGGYVTEALDVSGLTQPYLIRLRVEGLTTNTSVLISIQSSVTGFVSDTTTVAVVNQTGLIQGPGSAVEHTYRDFIVPSAMIGNANGRLRVLINSISTASTGVACTTTCSVTTSLLVQN